MDEDKKYFKTIEEYIETFPKNVQLILNKIRQTIKSTVPEATETISWQMPAFKLNGILVFFAAYKHHIGFYPTSSGIEAFKNEIISYNSSKGTVQFPFDRPIPYDLIKKIVLFRVKKNKEKK
jgi:uncharacterized protein YdhG (YjbR/CyaY superfamily)